MINIITCIGVGLVLIVLYDLIQKKHAIIRNFPIIGHLRYLLEAIGPELRQYIVTNNNEERPFSRDQRRWVYASSKKENNYFGFGSDEDIENASNHLIIKHSNFPLTRPVLGDKNFDPMYSIKSLKILGKTRNRKHQFRPSSIVNISAMSFGSLSANAIKALNGGAKLANCLHNTGEGGISEYHKQGGSLVWQIGTGYFGCRDKNGDFDINRLIGVIQENEVKAIEIKISQGAKPGAGGFLLGSKVSAEIANIRGIPKGVNCASPASHKVFDDVDSMLDFVELLGSETGLPVGIKSAVGEVSFWEDLAIEMSKKNRGVDFITIDGGEGGTGAGPLVFTDHISFPFKVGFNQVYQIFKKHNLNNDVVFIGSGKLGFPESAVFGLALGCDLINVSRTALFALGCIQAQKCHSGHCPTGIATQSKWLMRGLDPTHKAHRLANYILSLRKELLDISYACGKNHPALITKDQLSIVDHSSTKKELHEIFN